MRLKSRARTAGGRPTKYVAQREMGSTNPRSSRALRRRRIVSVFAALTGSLVLLGLVASRYDAELSEQFISPSPDDYLHFHGIAENRNQSDAIIRAVESLQPKKRCILHIHQSTPFVLRHSSLRCRIHAFNFRHGDDWARIPLGQGGRDVLISGKSGVSKNDLNWFDETWDAVRLSEAQGGVHDVAALVIPDPDNAPAAVMIYRDSHGRSSWDEFATWYSSKRGEWRVWPHIAEEYEKTPSFRRSRSNKHRDPALTLVGQLVGRKYTDNAENWKLWFDRWSNEYGMRMVVRSSESEPTKIDDPWSNLDSDSAYMNTLKSIVEAKRKDRIVLTIVDDAFLEITKNWLCNVQIAGFLPDGIVWLSLSSKVTDALSSTGIGTTVDLTRALLGSKGHLPEILYGHKIYWKLMLLRTRLLSDLVARGIEVFLFETDQAWLRDPFDYFDREASSDMIGTLDTQHNVAGNTLFLRATLPTRRLWREVYDRFKVSYDEVGVESFTEDETAFVEHDQHTLSDLLLYNEEFKHNHPVALALMNADLFVGGSWYSGFYKSEESKTPVIINNNFISGVSKKKKRAIQFGHWFLDDSGVCMKSIVEKALRYEFPNGPPKPE